jgi:hypothetical protein
MPAPLSLRIKERYMASRADGLSQQVAADAVAILTWTPETGPG